jgi:hypothetical protein
VATLWYTANGGAIAIFSCSCVKTNYIVIYYLKDKSTRSFVDALKYIDGLVRARKSYGVNTMYSDFLAAHTGTSDLEDIQDDLRIRLKATPPYLHWLNGYAKVYMRVLKADTYTRLLQAIGTPMGDDYITDATDLWCFFVEQSKLTNNSESLTTTKQVTDTYVNREQMFYEDT